MADTFKGIITADGKKRQLPYGNVLETPVSDETLSIPGAFADSKAVGDKFKEVKTETDLLKEDKITKPAEAPTIGKILRVKSANEDGTFTCEWTDGGNNWQIIMDETLVEPARDVLFKVPDDTKEMICFFKSGVATIKTDVYLRTQNTNASTAESFAPFGGSLETNVNSIGCQKIQFINSQYGLIDYSYLSHLTPSTTSTAQRTGKASVLRIDDKRFFFHSVNQKSGYPIGTRLLVLVRR